MRRGPLTACLAALLLAGFLAPAAQGKGLGGGSMGGGGRRGAGRRASRAGAQADLLLAQCVRDDSVARMRRLGA